MTPARTCYFGIEWDLSFSGAIFKMAILYGYNRLSMKIYEFETFFMLVLKEQK